jgi:NhaP-type Na+/H+ or K+/H+ antiporter
VRHADLLLDAAILVVLLVVLRLPWVYGVSWFVFALRRLMKRPAASPCTSEALVIGWTGMRGVIALAAAMSVPDADFAEV